MKGINAGFTLKVVHMKPAASVDKLLRYKIANNSSNESHNMPNILLCRCGLQGDFEG